MPFISLSGSSGYLVVGATPARITTNFIANGGRVAAHTIYIQQNAANTSPLYVLDRPDGSYITGVGVVATLIAPFSVSGSLTGLAWVAFTVPYAPGGLNASDYYLQAESAAQFATVSIVQA